MAVKKDAAFYRKQREDDEVKAKKGDKKAQAELAQIEKKRVASRGKAKPKTLDRGWSPSWGRGDKENEKGPSGEKARSAEFAKNREASRGKAKPKTLDRGWSPEKFFYNPGGPDGTGGKKKK
jgi:hypothetical protein